MRIKGDVLCIIDENAINTNYSMVDFLESK